MSCLAWRRDDLGVTSSQSTTSLRRGPDLLSLVTSDRTRRNGMELDQKMIKLDMGKGSSLRRWSATGTKSGHGIEPEFRKHLDDIPSSVGLF